MYYCLLTIYIVYNIFWYIRINYIFIDFINIEYAEIDIFKNSIDKSCKKYTFPETDNNSSVRSVVFKIQIYNQVHCVTFVLRKNH